MTNEGTFKSAPIRLLYGLGETLALELIGEISVYKSFNLVRRYKKYGTFELQIESTSSIAKDIKMGRIIYITDKKCGIIKQINTKQSETTGGDIISIKGFTLGSLLSQRITIPPIGEEELKVEGTISECVVSIIESQIATGAGEKRAMTFIKNKTPSAIGNRVKVLSRYKELDKEITRVLEMGEEGIEFAINIKDKTIDYTVFRGTDKTTLQSEISPVIFSREYSNLKSVAIANNEDAYKNFALVAGQGEGIDRTIVEVGDKASKGLDRHELFVDARDIDETIDLEPRGLEKLKEKEKIYTIESEVFYNTTFVFEKDYFLGDKVTIKVLDAGVEKIIHSRITEIKETWNEKGISIDVNFDKKIPDLIDKINSKIDARTVQQEISRGGVDTKSFMKWKGMITSESLNTLRNFGIYRIWQSTEGFPPSYTSDNDFILMVLPIGVEDEISSYDWQRNLLFDVRSNRWFVRSIRGGYINEWEENATKNKTTIPIPFSAGYKHNDVYSYASNIQKDSLNTGKIWVSVAKTDGTKFETGRSHLISALPAGFLSRFNCVGHAVGSDNDLVTTAGGTCTSILFNNGIYINVSVACYKVYGYIEYEVV